MIEYYSIDKFLSKKADLYNYINPFFDLNYLKSHNFFFLLIALQKYKPYFDNLYLNVDVNIRLDINQRIAILTNSKNELIIAGAGSGKTTTIAAKIKYMNDILKIDPKEILLLSYTNETVNDMKKTIVDKFKIDVKILTFHKFAISLLNGTKKIQEKVTYEEIKKFLQPKETALLLAYLYLFSGLTIKDIRAEQISREFSNLQAEINKYYFEKLELRKNMKTLLFRRVADAYCKYLDRFNTLDYLIYSASKLKEFDYHFKYILIDEYQDISNLRFEFIRNYINTEESNLMCVGDDWQTIFSFASSNVNNILNFSKTFNDTTVLKITRTYRNSAQLINIAGEFIMKNDRQIKKKLKSSKSIEGPIEIVKYRDKEDAIKQLCSLINPIADCKIAFLTRYRNDVYDVIDNVNFKLSDNKVIYKNRIEIDYLTIHTSKGLGFDYVFLINNKKGYYGFPPIRREKSIFVSEDIMSEERRLFYVALTRTKNKVYLLCPNRKYSNFIKEIKNMLKKNQNLL